ncbi:hypothetical protein NKH77_25420 [Streptomyces sp. M19]
MICARVLLPAAFDDERSLQARLDRLERGAALAGGLAGGGEGHGRRADWFRSRHPRRIRTGARRPRARRRAGRSRRGACRARRPAR